MLHLVEEQLVSVDVIRASSNGGETRDFTFACTVLGKQMMETRNATTNAREVLGYNLPLTFNDLPDRSKARTMVVCGNFYTITARGQEGLAQGILQDQPRVVLHVGGGNQQGQFYGGGRVNKGWYWEEIQHQGVPPVVHGKVPLLCQPIANPMDLYNGPPITALDIRVGRITRVWYHDEMEKLFCEEVNMGVGKPCLIASGLQPYMNAKDLDGLLVLVLCNLKEPASLATTWFCARQMRTTLRSS